MIGHVFCCSPPSWAGCLRRWAAPTSSWRNRWGSWLTKRRAWPTGRPRSPRSSSGKTHTNQLPSQVTQSAVLTGLLLFCSSHGTETHTLTQIGFLFTVKLRRVSHTFEDGRAACPSLPHRSSPITADTSPTALLPPLTSPLLCWTGLKSWHSAHTPHRHAEPQEHAFSSIATTHSWHAHTNVELGMFPLEESGSQCCPLLVELCHSTRGTACL